MTKCVVEEFTRLAGVAEQIRNTDPHVIETCSVGDEWRQGDVAIQFLGTEKPPNLKEIPLNRQLAPGNTPGSRHMLVGDGYTMFQYDKPIVDENGVNLSALYGPVILAKNGITVPHPEHGDVTFKECGYYGIRYEVAHADEIRRVQD